MKKMDLNGLFSALFAGVENVPELKEAANAICSQVKVAFEVRIKELAEAEGAVKLKPTTKGKKAVKEANEKKAEKARIETDKKAKAEAKKKAEAEKVEQVAITSLTKAQIKAMDIKFEKYSEKCFFMTGDTHCISQAIAARGGATWNRARQGWFMKTDTAKALAKDLGVRIAK